MEKNIIEQLVKIYNTLLLVSTKGEDTVIMGQCLGAFHQILTQLQKTMTSNIESADIE